MNSRKVQAAEAYLYTPVPSISEQQLSFSWIKAEITSKYAEINFSQIAQE